MTALLAVVLGMAGLIGGLATWIVFLLLEISYYRELFQAMTMPTKEEVVKLRDIKKEIKRAP